MHNKENAIIAGLDSRKREIYICRVLLQSYSRSTGFRTSWTPDELRSDGICAVGFDGKNLRTFKFLKIPKRTFHHLRIELIMLMEVLL